MHGSFRILGVALAFYVAAALRRGHVYARSGLWGRNIERDGEPFSYWCAILAYALLSAALMFVF